MSKILGIGAGFCGLAYGGYFLSQNTVVSKFEQDERAALKLVDAETKKVKDIGKSIADNEAKITSLNKEFESTAEAAKKMGVELEAKRKQLQALETDYAAKQAAVSKLSTEVQSVMAKTSSMKLEIERSTAALTMGEKSLKIARQQAIEARKLFNPLNHPKVQSLMGGKGK